MQTNHADDRPDYLSGLQASKLGGTNNYSLLSLAVRGKIRTRLDKFDRILFNVEDVLRLAEA